MITAPEKLRRARSAVAVDDREQRLLPDTEKVAARGLRLHVNIGSLEELDAFVAAVMDELGPVRRLVVGGRAARRRRRRRSAYVIETNPPWYERMRYPLHYGAIVRDQARASTASTRRCSPRSSTRSRSSEPTRSRRRARSG